jgi:hypothetical protein
MWDSKFDAPVLQHEVGDSNPRFVLTAVWIDAKREDHFLQADFHY